MDDLISRQAVLNATSTTLKITGKENAETVYEYIKKLCDDIKVLPSVDTVKVVRCKDCVENDTMYGNEENWCLKFGYTVHDDDFCSYGERETDE